MPTSLSSAPVRSRNKSARAEALLALLAVAALVVVAACGSSGGTSARVYTEGHGPLSALSGTGIITRVYSPHPDRWVSIGSLFVCKRTGSRPITITGMSETASTKPQKTVPYLRVVTATSTGNRTPIGSVDGKPPFNQPYDSFHDIAGTFTRGIDGTRISQSCRAAHSRIGTNYTEIVLAILPGPPGAKISAVNINYRVGNDSATLRVTWRLYFCGTAVTSPADMGEPPPGCAH